jgi:hypothetical protein
MDRISFDIFEPEKKRFHLTPNWIVFGLWFLAIGFLWLFDNILPDIGTVRGIVAGCIFLISMYYLIVSFATYKPLSGKLEGEIKFVDDCIIINGKSFDLKNISAIDFSFYDYYGKSSTYGRSFDPKLYQGVNNNISFIDNKNETHLVYFKMQTEHSYLSLAPFVNQAIKLNKMPFNRGIELLGIENVSIN